MQGKRKKRILFVDDEPHVLKALKRLFRRMNREWEMSFVTSGQDGLSEIRTQGFDCVVSDMKMPEMNGAEFLTQVKAISPDTVCLVLSGEAESALIDECESVVDSFLSKPCDVKILKEIINEC